MIYHRKKQSNKKHYIKLIFLITLIGLSVLNPIISQVSSNILSIITGPIYRISSIIKNETRNLVEYTIGTKSNRDQVDKLSKLNQDLLAENLKLKNIVNNSQDLKKASEFASKIKSIPARVITLESDNFFSKFTIDKGSKDGIKKGDIILSAYGSKSDNIVGALVGRVEQVNLTTSRVSSILDDRFNFTFTHSKTRSFGILDDRSGEEISGYMFDKDVEIKKGDLIYTSGIGGIYKEGIYIGEISDVRESDDKIRTSIKVKSPVDFKRIYRVFVIANDEVGNE